MSNNAEQIEKLLRLKEAGVLTENEFQVEKQKVLNANDRVLDSRIEKKQKEIKKSKPHGCLVVFCVFIGLGVLGSIFNSCSGTGSTGVSNGNAIEKKEETEGSKLVLSPWELIEVQKFDWHIGGFGNIGIVDKIEILNNSSVPVKDFTIQVAFSAPSGTELGSVQKVVYEVIPSKQKKTITNLNIGLIPAQSAKASALISRVKNVNL